VSWQPVNLAAADEDVWPLEALEMVRELVSGARPAWHGQAACRGQGTSTWFPEQGESLEPARAYCGACPVAAECVSAGLHEDFGVWASTSAVQRKRLRREAPRVPLPPIGCEWCGETFTPPTRTSRYCSRPCTKAASDARRRTAA
jgi:WhiB family redox-sensing transcriptional regulator